MTRMKLAIIGAGPSAFYVASRLLSLLPYASMPALRIHMYDRLWAPHGLVRYGVAPDHPEVKVRRSCTALTHAPVIDVLYLRTVHINLMRLPLILVSGSSEMSILAVHQSHQYHIVSTYLCHRYFRITVTLSLLRAVPSLLSIQLCPRLLIVYQHCHLFTGILNTRHVRRPQPLIGSLTCH
jgi:hypothetical protein